MEIQKSDNTNYLQNSFLHDKEYFLERDERNKE